MGCLSEVSWKLTRAAKHGDDLNSSALKPIDDAVRLDDDFANSGIPALGNNATGFWKSGELFDASDNATNDQLGVLNRIRADVRLDPDDIVSRLRRPNDRGHKPRRRLTSSCGTPLPASSSASPASILARNTSRSMASSNVASGGNPSMASRI